MDSHHPISQASTLQISQGLGKLSDLPKVPQQQVAEVPTLSSSLPTPSSLQTHSYPPAPSSCPSPTCLCQSPGVPSAHLSYSVKSLPPCRVLGEENDRRRVGGSLGPTAGPASRALHLRHQLPAPTQSCSPPAGLPTGPALGSSFILPPHSVAPAALL